jgi:SAM-dependent methyltransferase
MIPAVAAGLFGKYVTPETTPILDAGAGTGLMGSITRCAGVPGQVGIDISAGMLNKANERNVYKDLHQMVLGEKLDFPSDISALVSPSGSSPQAMHRQVPSMSWCECCAWAAILFSACWKMSIFRKGTKTSSKHWKTMANGSWWRKPKSFPGCRWNTQTMLNRVYVYRVC